MLILQENSKSSDIFLQALWNNSVFDSNVYESICVINQGSEQREILKILNAVGPDQ